MSPTSSPPSLASFPSGLVLGGGGGSGALAHRQPHTRASSHSHPPSSMASFMTAPHRVSRRKSVTCTQTNVAAVAAAALADIHHDAISVALPTQVTPLPASLCASTSSSRHPRRHTVSNNSITNASAVPTFPTAGLTLPSQGPLASSLEAVATHAPRNLRLDSAIDDSSNDASLDEAQDNLYVARIRRASDGSPLSPLVLEGKRSYHMELRCEQCGKGYKHSSCLNKHLWEHTPGWVYTSKLLISKHQQVQLLEAASVLVAMNKGTETMTPLDSTIDFEESPSPNASGYSEHGTGFSDDVNESSYSTDTTPPLLVEGSVMFGAIDYSTAAPGRTTDGVKPSIFSHSPDCLVPGLSPFQPISFSDRTSMTYQPSMSHDRHPRSSCLDVPGQEDQDLAAAVELLSCSFRSNTGNALTAMTPPNVPPVPPLPPRYLSQAKSWVSTGFIGGLPNQQPESFTRGQARLDGYRPETSESGVDGGDENTSYSLGRSEQEEYGFFGRMEE